MAATEGKRERHRTELEQQVDALRSVGQEEGKRRAALERSLREAACVFKKELWEKAEEVAELQVCCLGNHIKAMWHTATMRACHLGYGLLHYKEVSSYVWGRRVAGPPETGTEGAVQSPHDISICSGQSSADISGLLRPTARGRDAPTARQHRPPGMCGEASSSGAGMEGVEIGSTAARQSQRASHTPPASERQRQWGARPGDRLHGQHSTETRGKSTRPDRSQRGPVPFVSMPMNFQVSEGIQPLLAGWLQGCIWQPGMPNAAASTPASHARQCYCRDQADDRYRIACGSRHADGSLG